jgi:hypothetical protein
MYTTRKPSKKSPRNVRILRTFGHKRSANAGTRRIKRSPRSFVVRMAPKLAPKMMENVQNNFFCPVVNVIATPHPFHLLGSFQFLGHALDSFHLLRRCLIAKGVLRRAIKK